MDIMSILEGITATIICTLAGSFFRWMIKQTRALKAESPETRRAPRTIVKRQFYVCLFGLLISFAVFFSVRGSGFFPKLARTGAAIFAVYFYLLVWGAFDAAYTFYPPVEEPQDSSADHKTDAASEDMRDIH